MNSMKHRAVLIAEVRRDAAAACRHTGHAGGRIAIRKGAVAPAEFRNDVRDCAAVCRTGAAAEVIVSDNRLAIMDCADGVWNLSKNRQKTCIAYSFSCRRDGGRMRPPDWRWKRAENRALRIQMLNLQIYPNICSVLPFSSVLIIKGWTRRFFL